MLSTIDTSKIAFPQFSMFFPPPSSNREVWASLFLNLCLIFSFLNLLETHTFSLPLSPKLLIFSFSVSSLLFYSVIDIKNTFFSDFILISRLYNWFVFLHVFLCYFLNNEWRSFISLHMLNILTISTIKTSQHGSIGLSSSIVLIHKLSFAVLYVL